MIVLRGHRVTLRPHRPEEFDRVWTAVERWLPEEVAADRERMRERTRRRIAASGTWTEDGLDLAIEVEGRLVGTVQARRSVEALPPGVFELGLGLTDPADRGRGYGSEAMALLTRRLFQDEGAHRAQLSTDVGNAVMRRLAERLGFGFEGIMRGFMPSPGGPRDYALYGMTRTDFEDARDTWIRTS